MTEFIVSLVVTGLSIGRLPLVREAHSARQTLHLGRGHDRLTLCLLRVLLGLRRRTHFWLQWADSGLQWRADVMVEGPHIPLLSNSIDVFDDAGNLVETQNLGIIASQQDGGWFPFRIPYLIIRDIIALLIHVVLLAANIWYWNHWQTRDARAAAAEKAVEAPSEFGRPLIREGAR